MPHRSLGAQEGAAPGMAPEAQAGPGRRPHRPGVGGRYPLLGTAADPKAFAPSFLALAEMVEEAVAGRREERHSNPLREGLPTSGRLQAAPEGNSDQDVKGCWLDSEELCTLMRKRGREKRPRRTTGTRHGCSLHL